MANSYLSTNTLIASVKRRGMIPASQKTVQTADFLAFANEELLIGLVPTILATHEEFLVYKDEITLVASQSAYAIPYRAMGNKLRDVFYKDTNGNLQEMTRISPDDRSYFQASHVDTRFMSYYVQGDEIIIVPDVGTSVTGSLVMTYYLRPNQLVEESRIATITASSVVGLTTVFTASVPSAIITAFNADATTKFDLLQTKSPHKIRKFDITPTAVSTTSMTFTTTDLPTGANAIVTGDYIALANECIIPQIPDELHSILAQRVVARCLEALQDVNGLAAANNKLAEMENKTNIIIDDRVEGAPQKIVNYNNLMRSSRIRRGWF